MVTAFAEVVATSAAVAGTRARSAKVALLAGLLARLAPEEIEPTIGFLTGEVRQGRIGVGWRTLAAVDPTPAPAARLGVVEVDGAVAELASLRGPGSGARRAALLRDLLGRATADEDDFLRRLLAGELRQGALEGVMTDAVARAAGVPLSRVRRAAMLGGGIRTAATAALTGGAAALDAIGLRVLAPVGPMLAAGAATVAEALELTGPASVEWKLDGARVQVHRSDGAVRVFTRNLNEVTDRLPGVVRAALGFPSRRFVLDGEVLGVGDDTRPRAFQETMSAFGRRDAGGAGEGLVVAFFDVLHADGVDLLDEPLATRQEVLDRIAAPLTVPRRHTADVDEAAAVLDEALAHGHEGVVVKALHSRYDAGRRGGTWRKVKPVRTLDLVVLAAEWGHGRRHGWLSNLHLGARDPAGGFVMVGKTFKGLTDELLEWQTRELLARETGRDGIVVHVRPELVVEVALDGVQTSTRYPGGVALRFARVRRYRDDKAPSEADAIADVRTLLAGG